VLVTRSLVSVVDDDESVRESLPDLLREFGYAAQAFASAEEFLASDCICRTGCLKPGNHHAAAPRAGNEGTGRRATEIAKALKIGRASV
jgi:hypothetical protein